MLGNIGGSAPILKTANTCHGKMAPDGLATNAVMTQSTFARNDLSRMDYRHVGKPFTLSKSPDQHYMSINTPSEARSKTQR